MLVIGLNFLAARHFMREDLTGNHRYSLGPETLSYLKKIPSKPEDAPVVISLILPPDQTDENKRIVLEQLRTLMQEYEYEAQKIPVPLKIEEVDLAKDVDRVTKLTALGYTPVTQIMVVHDKRGQALTMADLYDTTRKDDGPAQAAKGFRGENAITSAILDVLNDKPDVIYFTKGHGEMALDSDNVDVGLSDLSLTLRMRNFTLKTIDLSTTKEIPADAKLVVIATNAISATNFVASTPFLPDEVEKLRHYLNERNGRLMVFLETGEKSGLESLFGEWGLRCEDSWIDERDPNSVTSSHDILVDPGRDPKREHELTKLLIMGQMKVLLGPFTRPVQIDPAAPTDERRQLHEILATSEQSFAIKDYHGASLKYDVRTDQTGPLSVAVLAEPRTTDGLHLDGGKLLVFGNADFIANKRFGDLGNPYLILNCVNYLTNRQNMLMIEPKMPNQEKLHISDEEYMGLSWRLAMLPAALALLGVGVFFVRNRT